MNNPAVNNPAVNSVRVAAGLFATLALLGASLASPPKKRGVPYTTHTSTTLRLIFGGDVMFGRGGQTCAPDALDAVADTLRAADLTLVNLETPLVPTPLVSDAPPDAFRAPPDAAERLLRAGIDAVSLANNHAMDAGATGLRTTLDALRHAGIATAGASVDGAPWAPTFLIARGARVALLAATDRRRPGRRPPEETRLVAMRPLDRLADRLPKRVRLLRERGDVDVIIVSLHWGIEGVAQPTAGQIALARALVDAGADVVWGHGAHAVHPVERRGGAVILYGAGNLSFDMHGPRTIDEGRRGALFELRLRRAEKRWRVEAVDERALVIDPGTCAPTLAE